MRFALANPALFRLIFANSGKGDLLAGQPEDEAFAFLRANATALAKEVGGDPQVVALQAWAIAHGLAMLMLDGQVQVDDAMIDHVIDAGVIRK